MKNFIRITLFIVLVTIGIFFYNHINDPMMTFKHWLTLIVFEMVFQMLIGDYIEKMFNNDNKQT
jgi:hypothetical protein